MNNKAIALLGLGGLALLVMNSGPKKASAASAPSGVGPFPAYGESLPDLVMTNFPSGAQNPSVGPAPADIQAQIDPRSIPLPGPVVTSGETPIVAPTVASAPTQATEDTVALVRLLLADEASGKGWKRLYPEVAEWQRSRGLKVDKRFGMVTALRVAQELGTLPLVRYWPKGSQQAKVVNEYRDALEALAAGAPEPRKAQLLAASAREQGQAFAANPGRPKTVISI